jgi:hypothetical protein
MEMIEGQPIDEDRPGPEPAKAGMMPERMGIILSILILLDAHFSYDTPSHSAFHIPFSRGACARELAHLSALGAGKDESDTKLISLSHSALKSGHF